MCFVASMVIKVGRPVNLGKRPWGLPACQAKKMFSGRENER